MPRPNKGLDHVDSLEGDPESKWRLKVILATLTGEMLVEEAYEELEVGPTQFANLRRQTLQAAVDGLVKKPGGRPRKETSLSAVEVAALQLRNAELERELTELRARVELALLPFLGKGTTSGARRAGRRRAGDDEQAKS
jgi:hypothetical protein